jgi:hypothetical protein
MTIGKDGTMTVNYSGMAPASYTAKATYGPLNVHGKVSATGTDSGTLDLKRAGVWQPTNLKLGLVAVTRMDGGGVFQGRPGESTGNFIGPVLAGTWRIAGKTLTVVGDLKSDVGSQHSTWVFSRIR